MYTHRYRLYLNRRDVRRSIHLVRQIRGRKRAERTHRASTTIWRRSSRN